MHYFQCLPPGIPQRSSSLSQTIAVGDGANDLPMLGEAGLGIAFHAKPRVVANAQQSINTIGIDGVLYFLGFKDSYLDEKGRSTN